MKLQKLAFSIIAVVFLHGVPAASQTVTDAPAATTTAFMDQLLSAGKSLLDSVYPEVSGLSTLTIPTSVVIDGSTYHVPAIALPTSSSSSSTTSSSSATSNTDTSITTTPKETSPAQTSSGLSRTPTDTPAAAKHGFSDRHLGIILGVVFGLVALALLAFILFLAWRRKKRTGYWLKRDTPPSDEEVTGWRSGHPSWLMRRGSTPLWSEKERYAPIDASAPHMASMEPKLPYVAATAAGGAVGAGALAAGRHHSGNSDSSDPSSHRNRDGYYTPVESAAEMTVNDGPYARAHRASSASQDRNSNRISLGHDYDREIEPVPDPYAAQYSQPKSPDRPPTPLLHTMFGALTGKKHGHERPVLEKRHSIPRKPVPAPIRTHDLNNGGAGVRSPVSPVAAEENPFVHPDDDIGVDEDYSPPPVLPTRSPDRRHSPRVHYPSGPEISKFDFGLSKEQLRELREAGEGGRASHGFGQGPSDGGYGYTRRSWMPPRREWSYERETNPY